MAEKLDELEENISQEKMIVGHLKQYQSKQSWWLTYDQLAPLGPNMGLTLHPEPNMLSDLEKQSL